MHGLGITRARQILRVNTESQRVDDGIPDNFLQALFNNSLEHLIAGTNLPRKLLKMDSDTICCATDKRPV